MKKNMYIYIYTVIKWDLPYPSPISILGQSTYHAWNNILKHCFFSSFITICTIFFSLTVSFMKLSIYNAWQLSLEASLQAIYIHRHDYNLAKLQLNASFLTKLPWFMLISFLKKYFIESKLGWEVFEKGRKGF